MTHAKAFSSVICGALLALPVQASSFSYGHFFLGDGGNPDILEYDAAHDFVRSFEASLPSGQSIEQVNFLRWGANGNLFAWGRFNDGTGDRQGAMEWNGDGTLAKFTPYNLPDSEVWGFETGADGSFFLSHFEQTGVDGNGAPIWSNVLRKWDSSLSNGQVFTSLPNAEGHEEISRVGDTLYVTGAGWVATYDIQSLTETSVFGVSWDIDRNASSFDGRLAVDYQWGADDNLDAVEIYDLPGSLLATGNAPNNDWNLKALAFDGAGILHVMGDHGDGTGNRVMHVSSFAADGTYLGDWQPENLTWHGPIAVAVPEPETWATLLIGLGLVGLFARGRATDGNAIAA